MKVTCPWHDDANPSLEIYPDGVYCWVCGAKATIAQYQAASGRGVTPVTIKEKEDLQTSIDYIRGLPKAQIRGLELATDGASYFIVWPGEKYYLRRFFVDVGSRYLGPTGHKRPLFIPSEGKLDAISGRGKTVLIVEGEINALSVSKVLPDLGVMSPGSATEFANQGWNLPRFLNYDRQVIIADEDAPGATACIKLAAELQKKSRDVQCVLMNPDANDWLTVRGEKALKEEVLGRIKYTLV